MSIKRAMFIILSLCLFCLFASTGCKSSTPEPTDSVQTGAAAGQPEKTSEQEKEASQSAAPSFTVLCRTEKGDPMPDTRADVCDGSSCRTLKADENGLISFYGLPGRSYDITPAAAPEGYRFVTDRAFVADKPDMRFEFILEKEE